MPSPANIGAAIAAAARTLNQGTSLEQTLEMIAEVARDSVPGIDQVGISTLDKDGRITTRAATGELVWQLDKIQFGIEEGPCFDALLEASVVTASDIEGDQRWPRYATAAVEAGLQSQLAVRLYLDAEGTIGVLNLYSTSQRDIDPDAEQIADLFAAHAAIALSHARDRENLNEALQSRKVIGQAIGIVAERYQMDEDGAFAFLVRASSHGNLKLRDVAQEIVDVRNGNTRSGPVIS